MKQLSIQMYCNVCSSKLKRLVIIKEEYVNVIKVQQNLIASAGKCNSN